MTDVFCLAFCVDQPISPCFSVCSFGICGLSLMGGLGAFDVSDQGATF